MVDSNPSETLALKILLSDLVDGLDDRTKRLRFLIALENDFGQDRGLLLPGGSPAHFAYQENRQAFVSGNFLAVILLSQCVLENVLAAELAVLSVSREIKGETTIKLRSRPTFRETVLACRGMNILTSQNEADLLRLSELRNALTHFRDVNDPSHIDRRAVGQRRMAADLCEEDARFAITVFMAVLAKPEFRFKTDD